MTDAELRKYKDYLSQLYWTADSAAANLDKIRNYNSKPIMRKLKMEGIFKILSNHTK